MVLLSLPNCLATPTASLLVATHSAILIIRLSLLVSLPASVASLLLPLQPASLLASAAAYLCVSTTSIFACSSNSPPASTGVFSSSGGQPAPTPTTSIFACSSGSPPASTTNVFACSVYYWYLLCLLKWLVHIYESMINTDVLVGRNIIPPACRTQPRSKCYPTNYHQPDATSSATTR